MTLVPNTVAGTVSDHTNLQITLVPGYKAGKIAETWTALEELLQPVRITTTWDWVSSWIDAYGHDVAHWFAIARLGDMPIGIALLTCSSPKPMRNLGIGIVHIGTSGEPVGHGVGAEYNDILVSNEYRRAFAKKLLRTIRRELYPVTIQLKAYAPEDIQAFLDADPTFRKQILRSPAFDLKESRDRKEPPISMLRSGVRSRVRRSTKALQPITTEWATTQDQATDILDDLIVLHEKRWNAVGRKGAFYSPKFSTFHRSIVAKLLPKGEVILFRVRQGDTTVGCLYSFVERGSVLFYQSGFQVFDDNKIKPGLTTHMLCIEECARRGLDTYDFLAGEHRYKDELATSERTLINAFAPGHALMSPLVDLALRPDLKEKLENLYRWRERASVSRG